MAALRLISPTSQPDFCNDHLSICSCTTKCSVSVGCCFSVFVVSGVCFFVCFFAWRRQTDWDRERTNSYKGLTLVGADADIYQSVVFDHHHAFDELA